MVNPRSRLFEEHPEWAVGFPGRPRSELRNQYVLDMSNREELAPLGKVYDITVFKGANEKELRNELQSFLTSALMHAARLHAKLEKAKLKKKRKKRSKPK